MTFGLRMLRQSLKWSRKCAYLNWLSRLNSLCRIGTPTGAEEVQAGAPRPAYGYYGRGAEDPGGGACAWRSFLDRVARVLRLYRVSRLICNALHSHA